MPSSPEAWARRGQRRTGCTPAVVTLPPLGQTSGAWGTSIEAMIDDLAMILIITIVMAGLAKYSGNNTVNRSTTKGGKCD